jgi:K+-sensing histidine kinase KdpD
MRARPLSVTRPLWLRYGVAVGLVALFVGVKLLLSVVVRVPPLGRDAPFLLMLVPTLVAAWFGGIGPGLAAASLGILGVHFFFLMPYYDVRVEPGAAIHSAVYAVQSYLLAAFMATVQSSRVHAEVAARRMEGMYAVSAALGGIRSVPEVTEVIVHEAATVLGAEVVSAWFMADDERTLRKVVTLGASGREFRPPSGQREPPTGQQPFEELSIDAQGPIALAARSRSLVSVEDLQELRARFPDVESAARGYFIPPAFVCAPMVVQDRIVGVLLIAWLQPRRLNSDEREWVKAIAQDCGTAAQRARLLETERRARTEAEDATRAKDEFLASVSNELRAPLTTIIGWAHLLKKEKGGDRSRYEHGLDVIERSAQAQARLVADIIEMSRIAARRFKVDVRPVDLPALVRSAVDELNVVAAAWGIDLEQGPLTPATVVADPARIAQVMHYVVSNAFKSTPPGGHVRVRLDVGQHRACVHVSDDGAGLSPEERNRIFEGFRKQNDGSGDRLRGLGLAMPIAKHIVEEHRGRLRIHSPGPGQGTTVTIELPLAEPVAGMLAVSGARSSSARLPLRGIRVLVVDDDPDAREVLSEMLASEGADVRPAPSASEALETLEEFSPGVIVCDTGLPEDDSTTFVRKLRERPEPIARVPAVALVEHARPDRVKAAKEAGFARQLPKPPDPRALIQAVADLGASQR